jgi:hypothetical protein
MGAVNVRHAQVRPQAQGSGLPELQAEALVEAFREAQGEADRVTRKDLQIELAPVKQDLSLVKWMVGLLLAGVAALVLRAFFPG